MRTLREIHKQVQEMKGCTREEYDTLEMIDPKWNAAALARQYPDLTPYQILALRRAKGDKNEHADKTTDEPKTEGERTDSSDSPSDGEDGEPGDSEQRPEPADDSAGAGDKWSAGRRTDVDDGAPDERPGHEDDGDRGDEQSDSQPGNDSDEGTGDGEGASGSGTNGDADSSAGDGARPGRAGNPDRDGTESEAGDGEQDGSGDSSDSDSEADGGGSTESAWPGSSGTSADGAGDNGEDYPDSAHDEVDLSDVQFGKGDDSGTETVGKWIGGESGFVTYANLSDKEATHKMRMALARMSGGFGKFVTTPLWDYGKLVRRIASKQDYMPAKKEDDGNPVILFLCDTSGSCDHISKQATTVAHSASVLGVRGADVWVVYHDDLRAHTIRAMHNGKDAAKELDARISKLKVRAANETQDILSVIRPQLVINITDIDSIKLCMDDLALGGWRTLVLDTFTEKDYYGRRYCDGPSPRAGLFYTLDALSDEYVGISSYSDFGRESASTMRQYVNGSNCEAYGRKYYAPNPETLPRATVMANRYLLWSFHNDSISTICQNIDTYASPDRLARLIVRMPMK